MAAIPSVELETHPDELPEAPPQKQSALTPPTSEDMDKREDASSELSELDMDMGKDEDEADDDIGDIEPGYYYEDGRIPVFTPVCSLHVPGMRAYAFGLFQPRSMVELAQRSANTMLRRRWINSRTSKSSSTRLTSTE